MNLLKTIMDERALEAYRSVSSYTIEALKKTIEEIANTKEKNDFVRRMLFERKEQLEGFLKVIEDDKENMKTPFSY